MSKPAIAVVAGSTGAVGHWVVRELMDNPKVGQVFALVRKPNVTPDHPKVKEILLTGNNDVDFERLPKNADVVYSCIGTTMAKAGSKEAFRAVDYGFTTELAAAARRKGVPQFHLVSALGANKDSFFFYNRVKGEVEEFVHNLRFPRAVMYRPSVLADADRKETRIVEPIASFLLGMLSYVTRAGVIGRAAPIPVHNVAKAMVADSMQHLDELSPQHAAVKDAPRESMDRKDSGEAEEGKDASGLSSRVGRRDVAGGDGRRTPEWEVYEGSTAIENVWRRASGLPSL